MADDARMVKATLAAGIFHALAVTTNGGVPGDGLPQLQDTFIERVGGLTERLFTQLFPPSSDGATWGR